MQFDDGRWFAPAGRPRFEKHSVGNLAWPPKALCIREAIVSTESTYGLTLAPNKRQRRMLSYDIPESL